MPKFAVIVTTDDAMDEQLYGKPYDADGLQLGLEAAFSQNGLEVVDIHQFPADDPDFYAIRQTG